MALRHLMSPLDFSTGELDKLMDLANDIEKYPQKYAHACAGKKIATLFYEPSTRTRLSFEAAMLNLGGSVLGFHSSDSSSAAKGESVSDTMRIVSCYADIAAMRHPKEGAPLVASMKSMIPVIKQYAQPLLFSVPEDDPQYYEARRLLKFLDYFLGIPLDDVPTNSILREFLGGGCFRL